MIDATPALRFFAGRRLAALARQDAPAAQRATLAALVRQASATRFGRDHGFATIRGVEDFQRAVPLRRWEDFWRDYWQAAYPGLRDVTWPGTIPFFALTSGTSGGPAKRIPVSRAMTRSNTGAGFDTMAFHLAARPASRVFGGANFLLGGSTALERPAQGVREGDLSGIAADRLPWWAGAFAFPPRELALIGDWEKKVAALAPASLRRDIRSVSGTPSWMLVFFNGLAALRPERPRRLVEYWPNLELVVHGGVAFGPYRDAFAAWLEGSHAETREVYPASEGFIAAADRGPDEGMRMVVDRGLFYEFVRPADLGAAAPERRWLGNAEIGVEYALVLSSNAGLWAYVLGDTVRLIELAPPRLVVTGRTSYMLSAFGEHVIGEELDQAVSMAARALGATVADFAAGPVFGDVRGGHLFVVELNPTPAGREAAFAAVVDSVLADGNADYTAHRSRGFGMAPPEVLFAPPGSFAAWMLKRGRLGGQNKVPRVINDPGLLADLRAFVAGPRGEKRKGRGSDATPPAPPGIR